MIARIVALACLLCAALAHAETRYITDKLSVELRRGPGNEYKITRNLEAGLSVEVVEQTPDGYSRVHVGETEGWVLTQFLTTERSARDRLAGAERCEGALDRSRASSRRAHRKARRHEDRARPHAREPRQGEPRLVEHQNRGGQRRRHTAAERELASENDRSRSSSRGAHRR